MKCNMKMLVFLMCLFFTGITFQAYGVGELESQNAINVMLVALEGNKSASGEATVSFDNWEYWESEAPGLVDYLINDLGFNKIQKETAPGAASVMTINAVAGKEGDFPLELLDERAKTFTADTGRASLVILWQPMAGTTWALLYGIEDTPLSGHIRSAEKLNEAIALLPAGGGFQLRTPPCLLSHSGVMSGEKMKQSLVSDYRERLVHLLSALQYKAASHPANPIAELGVTSPGSATIQLTSTARQNIGQSDDDLLISIRGLGTDKSTPEVLVMDRVIPHFAIVDRRKNVAYELDGKGVFHTTPLDDFLKGEQDPGFFSLKGSDIRVRDKAGQVIKIREIPEQDWQLITNNIRELASVQDGKQSDYRFTKFQGGDLVSDHCADAGLDLFQSALERNGYIPQRAKGFTAFTDNPRWTNGRLVDWVTVDIVGGGQTNPVEVSKRFDRVSEQSLKSRMDLYEAVRVHKLRGAEDYDINKHGIGSNTPRDYQGTIIRFPNATQVDAMKPKSIPEFRRQDPVYDGGPKFSPWGPGDGPPPPPAMNVNMDPFRDTRNRSLEMTTQNMKNMGSFQQPGGVLFAPEIEIVIGNNGFTSEIEKQVTDAFAGSDKVSTPVTIDGKEMMAVRMPGSRKLFEIRVGYFYFTPRHSDNRDLILTYSSGLEFDVGLGCGWSVAPFYVSRRSGQTELVDFLGSTRYPYTIPAAESRDSGTNEFVLNKVSSLLQPTLVVMGHDGYQAEFADGRTILFDANGLMLKESIGERTLRNYEYQNGRLMSMKSQGGSFRIEYSGKSIFIRSDREDIECNVNDGRLMAYHASDARFSFDYDPHGWLAKGGTDGRFVFENMYDREGQLVFCKNAEGRTEYSYDHWSGKLVVRAETGKSETYFYDKNQRVVAYGSDPKEMVLLNYDITGRLIQMALGEHLNADDPKARPRFRIVEML